MPVIRARRGVLVFTQLDIKEFVGVSILLIIATHKLAGFSAVAAYSSDCGRIVVRGSFQWWHGTWITRLVSTTDCGVIESVTANSPAVGFDAKLSGRRMTPQQKIENASPFQIL